MYHDVHLVVFAIQRLVAALVTSEPSALVGVQRDIKRNAIEKYLSCHRIIDNFAALFSKLVFLHSNDSS